MPEHPSWLDDDEAAVQIIVEERMKRATRAEKDDWMAEFFAAIIRVEVEPPPEVREHADELAASIGRPEIAPLLRGEIWDRRQRGEW